jgi:hypothetical protein
VRKNHFLAEIFSKLRFYRSSTLSVSTLGVRDSLDSNWVRKVFKITCSFNIDIDLDYVVILRDYLVRAVVPSRVYAAKPLVDSVYCIFFPQSLLPIRICATESTIY